jgi:hypothetical protein
VADLVNKQGDVSLEMVRQSLLATETLSGTGTTAVLSGLGQIIDALGGSVDDMVQAYKALSDVRLTLRGLGIDGAAVGAALLNGAGGLQALTDGLGAFEQNFLTPAEQQALKMSRLNAEFAKLGMTTPATREAFKALVQGVDVSTEAGQKLLGQLLPLSGAFAEAMDGAGGLTGALGQLGAGLADEIKRIRGLMSTGSGTQSLGALQSQFAIATAQARAGDQAAVDALPEISRAMLDLAAKTASSRAELVRLQQQTADSLLATLAAVNPAAAAEIPRFAAGGMHTGGLAVVGERGPELAAMGAARVYTARQTADIMGGASETAAAVHAVREEVAALRAEQQAQALAIAAAVTKTARILDRVTPEGDAIQTRAAV